MRHNVDLSDMGVDPDDYDSAFCVCDCRTMHWSEEIGHWLCNGCNRLVERWINDQGPNFPPDDDYDDEMDYSFMYDDDDDL